MRTIRPSVGLNSPELEAAERTVAEDQLEYAPVVALTTEDNGESWTVVRWTLTDEERQRVASGEDIAVTFPGGAVMPHSLRLMMDAFPPEVSR